MGNTEDDQAEGRPRIELLLARSRKRPKQARSRATVEAILDATAELLVRHGLDALTTNHVADRAGVSVGSVYQYFPNKSSLVAGLVERHANRRGAILTASLGEGTDDPVALVRSVVCGVVASHRHASELHRILILAMVHADHVDGLLAFNQRVTDVVTAYLIAHSHLLRPKRLDVAAFMLVQSVEATVHRAVVDRPELLDDDGLVDELTVMLSRYLFG
ncbi:MAG: AcrR family transcriptional regulator [Myxococcota bacterium]|jgi:AcrR family transcriptional regulator